MQCKCFLFFVVSTHTWSLQHVLYFSFLPTILFSGSRRLQDNCYFMLYIACIFFLSCARSSPAVSTITIRLPLCPPYALYLHDVFLYSPNPWATFYPTRAYLWIPWNDRYV